jgi:hypothetical protein
MTSTGSVAETARAAPVPESPDQGVKSDIAPDKVIGRSERNIAAWRSYLPEDCVAAMIAMGWDEST